MNYIYKALLSQTSTNPPEAILNCNTLGGEITFTYISPGEYGIISDGLFLEGKTHAYLGLNFRPISGLTSSYQLARLNDNELRLLILDNGTAIDDNIQDTPITIEVYK